MPLKHFSVLPTSKTSVPLRSKLPASSGMIQLASDITHMSSPGNLLMGDLQAHLPLATKVLQLLDSRLDQLTSSPLLVLLVPDQKPQSPPLLSPPPRINSKESKTPTVKQPELLLCADGAMESQDITTLSSLSNAPEARDKRSSSLKEEINTESPMLAPTVGSNLSPDMGTERHKSSFSIFKLVNLQSFFPFL